MTSIGIAGIIYTDDIHRDESNARVEMLKLCVNLPKMSMCLLMSASGN
jgi:hypothetical protein